MTSKLYTKLTGGATSLSSPGELIPINGHTTSPASGKIWVIRSMLATTTVVTSVDWQAGIQIPSIEPTSFQINWRGAWTAMHSTQPKAWYWNGTLVLPPQAGIFAQTVAGSFSIRVSGWILQVPTGTEPWHTTPTAG